MGKANGVWILIVLGVQLLAPSRSEAADKELQWKFLMAVHHGKLDEIRAAVAAGAEVNALIDGRYLALNFAAQDNYVEFVRYLLSTGAAVDASDRDERFALATAVANRNLEVVALLLAAGASVKAKDANGNTALHFAAATGIPVLASLLLKRGAPLEAKNLAGRTPLFFATQYSALTYAKETGEPEAATLRLLILKGAGVDARDAAGMTPLHVAADNGIVPAARVLLEHGADLAARDGLGNSVAIHSILTAGGK